MYIFPFFDLDITIDIQPAIFNFDYFFISLKI